MTTWGLIVFGSNRDCVGTSNAMGASWWPRDEQPLSSKPVHLKNMAQVAPLKWCCDCGGGVWQNSEKSLELVWLLFSLHRTATALHQLTRHLRELALSGGGKGGGRKRQNRGLEISFLPSSLPVWWVGRKILGIGICHFSCHSSGLSNDLCILRDSQNVWLNYSTYSAREPVDSNHPKDILDLSTLIAPYLGWVKWRSQLNDSSELNSELLTLKNIDICEGPKSTKCSPPLSPAPFGNVQTPDSLRTILQFLLPKQVREETGP